MRGNFYARHTETATINVTPLIDVMLVLMVVFLIAMPVFARRIDVDLPQPDEERELTPPPTMTLRVLGDGSVDWDGVVLPRDALPEQLRVTAAREPQPALLVDAEPGTPYETVAPVFAQAREHGIRALSFAEPRSTR